MRVDSTANSRNVFYGSMFWIPTHPALCWRDSTRLSRRRNSRIYRRRPPRRLFAPMPYLAPSIRLRDAGGIRRPPTRSERYTLLLDAYKLGYALDRSRHCSAFHLYGGGDLRGWRTSSWRSFSRWALLRPHPFRRRRRARRADTLLSYRPPSCGELHIRRDAHTITPRRNPRRGYTGPTAPFDIDNVSPVPSLRILLWEVHEGIYARSALILANGGEGRCRTTRIAAHTLHQNTAIQKSIDNRSHTS